MGYIMSDPIAPKIDPDKLDFSQWHPLDHRPLSKRCRDHYGGFRNHMNLLWDFKWDMHSKVKKVTHCFWGRHHSSPHWRGDGTPGSLKYAGQMCCWCLKDLPEKVENST